MKEQFSELEKKIKRKRTTRWVMIAVAVLIAAAICAAIFIPKAKPVGASGTASIEIRCDQLSADLSQLKDPNLAQYIPEDGIIFSDNAVGIKTGETTVFDLLIDVCTKNDIQIEYSGTPVYGGSYIEGIHYLYEYSAGQYSGWKYTVNGESPSYAADKVKLQDGDHVVWYYAVDYRSEGM